MPRSAEVISHWHHTLENFNTSALDFYRSVEASLLAKEAPNVRVERVDWSESGILSAKREYLRVSYGRFSFDLCAAPFGKDYFFSWWLVKRQPDAALLYGCLGLIAIPIVLLTLIQMAGFIGGLLAFLFAIALGFAMLLNSARSGSGIVEDAVLAIPVLGALYTRFSRPVTYYSTDSRVVFEETVHRIVLEHLGALLTLQSLPPLSPEEAKSDTRKALS